MNEDFRLALVGPDPGIPCGISDYVQTLLPALRGIAKTEFLSYSDALDKVDWKGFSAVLVHYERSLVPHRDFLRDLGQKHSALFVVPHEVYERDPFAFPAAQLRGTLLTLPLKRWLYAWRHREYGREIRLQQKGYHARGIFPMNRRVLDILKQHCPNTTMNVVPHAMYPFPRTRPTEGRGSKFILGLFGFLTPAHDYATLFDALEDSPDTDLLILGGSRTGKRLERELRVAISDRKLDTRVTVTGYIPETELGSALNTPDAFIFPARFKSSSGSLLRLLGSEKPILVADIPLTRELKEEGAPLTLYRGKDALALGIVSIRTGKSPAETNRYRHTFQSVADQYIRAIREKLAPNP